MSPDRSLTALPRPPSVHAWTAAVALVAVWAVLRLGLFHTFLLPLTYVLPLFVCVWTRSMRMLWSMAAAFVVLHAVEQALMLRAGALTPRAAAWSAAATFFNIVVAAFVIGLILRLRTRLEEAVGQADAKRAEALGHAARAQDLADALSSQNDELAQQAEELSRQAEELAQRGDELGRQSEALSAQNEELKAQSEEIQSLNSELERREQLLQSLLEAVRTAGSERAAAERLCSATLELVGSPAAVAVVREQRGGQLNLVGSAGVAQAAALPGPAACAGTFAEIIIRQGRAASLSDAGRRPDLALMEVEGERPFQSVLSTPMAFPPGGVGVLEVYARVAHEWTEEQYRLVRWLALQGSQIVETLRLQDEMRRQAALIELSPDATIVQDLVGRITFWSRAAEELYGWTREEALGRTTSELMKTKPDSHSIRQLALERGRVTCELQHTTKDGREIIVASRWLAQKHGGSGEGLEFLESNTDITERKRVEEALREADQHKNRFLATLSHELRNPLAPIRYALQVLSGGGGQAGAERRKDRHAIEVIERQLTHLVRLVDDLLDLTRIASNKIKLQRRAVRVDGIVRQAAEAAAPAIRNARHELVVALPPEDVWVDGDAERLAQVLINLLNNAARYTPDGGVITVAAGAEGGAALLSVKDTGIGISPDDLPSLFRMFSQVGDGSGGGLGIGLALVKGVVELHGGSVEARSAGIGLGSEFLVRLPLAAAPAAERPEPTKLQASAPRRVLVVDDNADAAQMMKAVLELDGHQVAVAYDGPSALARATEFVPDVVLLDIGLPTLDGYEVARGLRADVRMRHAHLVAVTGWGQEDDRARARQSGFDAHLTKPADPEEIRRLVASAGKRGETTGTTV